MVLVPRYPVGIGSRKDITMVTGPPKEITMVTDSGGFKINVRRLQNQSYRCAKCNAIVTKPINTLGSIVKHNCPVQEPKK